MSNELIKKIINKMRYHLNSLLEKNNYNTQDSKIQDYSKRLDKVLVLYNKLPKK